MLDLLDQLRPRDSHTLKLENGKLKLIDADGVEWIEDITSTQVIAKGGTNPWNKFLDGFPPLKNFIYKVDNYTYHTDELGRVNKVEGNLSNIERGRYETQQGKAVDLKDGIKGTDDGGHLIANVLYGPGEQINYVPMNLSLNRGAWKSMENRLKKAVDEGKTVSIEIEIDYPLDKKRPSILKVKDTIEGKITRTEFENTI